MSGDFTRERLWESLARVDELATQVARLERQLRNRDQALKRARAIAKHAKLSRAKKREILEQLGVK